MIHLRLLTMLAITPALFLSVSTALANTVYGTPADLTGVRSVGEGLDVIDARKPGKGRAGDWSSGMVTWTITPDAGGYLYEYELSGFNGPPAVSHFVVDLTNEALDEPGIVTDATVDSNIITPAEIIIGDVEGLIGAVKFDVGASDESGSVTYRFRSTRSPVWGHIAVEAGQEQASTHYLVQNTAFADPTQPRIGGYIARPNGLPTSQIPEPTTLATLALGAVVLLRRRPA